MGPHLALNAITAGRLPLSAIEAPNREIEGLVAAVPEADWRALDERERAYARHGVTEINHDHASEPVVEIYKVEPHHLARDEDHPILLSYLDTVVQGYLREFGEAGATRFFDSTTGWELSVLDARADPIYPRAEAMSTEERGVVDDRLLERKVRIRRA